MGKLYIAKKYGQAPNHLLNDLNLSLKAKGLFTFLQSKPEEWEFSKERIAQQTKEGKEAVMTAIHELEEAGYLQRILSKEKRGTFDGYDYILSEEPSTSDPSTQEPSTENPSTEYPDDIVKKKDSKQEVVKKNQKKNQKKEQKHDLNWAREARDGTADVSDLSEKYEVSESFIRDASDEMVNYIEAHGKKYKDHKAMLRNWIKNKRKQPRSQRKSPHNYGKWTCKQGYEHEKGEECGHQSITISNNKFNQIK